MAPSEILTKRQRWFKWGLRNEGFVPSVPLLVTLLSLIFVVLSNFSTSQMFLTAIKSSYMVPNIKENSRRAAQAVLEDVMAPSQRNYERINAKLSPLLTDPVILHTRLMTADGTYIFDSNAGEQEGQRDDSRIGKLAAKAHLPFLETSGPEGSLTFDYIVPIRTNHEYLGALRITYSERSLESLFLSLKPRVAANMAIVLVLTFLAILIFFWWLTKPLADIADTSLNVLKYQDLDLRVRERGVGQIKNLTHIFNRLLEGLKDMVALENETRQTIDTFAKYLPPKIVKMALSGNLELGGQEKFITVMYIDAKNFTHYTNDLGAREVVKMLVEFRRIVDKTIFEFEGTLDKHIGDGFLAYWGAPLEREDREETAVKCLFTIIDRLKVWNEIREVQGLPEVEIWAAVASGPAVVGNIGFEERFEYTAIGSVVNVVSRIVDAGHKMQKSFLIDRRTHLKLAGKYPMKDLGAVKLRGISTEVQLFEVIPPHSEQAHIEKQSGQLVLQI